MTEDQQSQEEIKNSKINTKSEEKIQQFEIGPEDECQFVPLISEEDDRKRHKFKRTLKTTWYILPDGWFLMFLDL